jgi:signal transduction histidine kinase
MSARNRSQPTGSHEGLSLTSALHDCFACGVLVVNHREQIISCAPEALRLLRLPPSPAAKAPLSQLPAALQKIIRQVAAVRAPVTERTVALSGEGSDSITLHVTAVPVQAGTKSCDVVVVLNDISVTRRLEQYMSRLDRLASIGTVSASMGHEIKNALVAVKIFTDLLLDNNRDAELADVVRREMRRIDSIVSQMLKFAGPARPTLSAVRLHEILDHSLRLVQPQIAGKLISLNRSFKAAPDAIEGDDYQLEQAFVNLFLNAIEAMGTNGSLTVATEIIPASPAKAATLVGDVLSQVRVTIADTGMGVAPEHMDHLFEPFFTTKNHGTGLGLPITKRIFQEHHGDISVRSEVNKGTTFNILLPASAISQAGSNSIGSAVES